MNLGWKRFLPFAIGYFIFVASFTAIGFVGLVPLVSLFLALSALLVWSAWRFYRVATALLAFAISLESGDEPDETLMPLIDESTPAGQFAVNFERRPQKTLEGVGAVTKLPKRDYPLIKCTLTHGAASVLTTGLFAVPVFKIGALRSQDVPGYVLFLVERFGRVEVYDGAVGVLFLAESSSSGFDLLRAELVVDSAQRTRLMNTDGITGVNAYLFLSDDKNS